MNPEKQERLSRLLAGAVPDYSTQPASAVTVQVVVVPLPIRLTKKTSIRCP